MSRDFDSSIEREFCGMPDVIRQPKHVTEVFQTHNPTDPKPNPYWDGKCSCGATWITMQPVYQCPASVPDRVIPDDLKDIYENGSHDPVEMAALVHELIERVASLEAEKQAAHTAGWMRAVYAILAEMQASNTLRVFVSYYRDKFSKPTAAKPEPSPSSANRAEGRQG